MGVRRGMLGVGRIIIVCLGFRVSILLRGGIKKMLVAMVLVVGYLAIEVRLSLVIISLGRLSH